MKVGKKEERKEKNVEKREKKIGGVAGLYSNFSINPAPINDGYVSSKVLRE